MREIIWTNFVYLMPRIVLKMIDITGSTFCVSFELYTSVCSCIECSFLRNDMPPLLTMLSAESYLPPIRERYITQLSLKATAGYDIQHSPVNNVPCHCPQCERRYPEQWHFDGHSISTTSWQWYYPSHHNSCVMYSLPEFKLMKENTIYWNMCLVRCWKKEFETRSVTPSTLCWCRRLLDVWLVSEEPHPRVLR